MLKVPQTKQGAVDAICDLFEEPRMAVGAGSTEPKAVLTLIVRELGLDIDEGLRKPELGQAIAEAAGLPWGNDCDSRTSPSGGGDTVTLLGLTRVLEAATTLLDRPGMAVEPPPTESSVEKPGGVSAVGAPYREASGTFSADETAVIQDWEKLERSTVAHAELQNRLAKLLRDRGLEPRSPTAKEPQFDLAWTTDDGRVFMCEVKSATAENRHQQVRLALGQILEYRYLMHVRGHTNVETLVLLEVEPSVDERAACNAVDVEVVTLDSLSERVAL